MTNQHTRLVLASGILLLSILAIKPIQATADCIRDNGTEDFENYTAALPPPLNCLYTNNSPSSGTVLTPPTPNPSAQSGTRVWFNDGATTAGLVYGESACASSQNGNPVTYSFDFRFNGAITGGGASDYVGVFIGSGAGGTTTTLIGLGVRASDATPVVVLKKGTAGTPNGNSLLNSAVALTTDTWYHGSLTIDDNSAAANTCDPTVTASIYSIDGATLYGYKATTATGGEAADVGSVMRGFTYVSGAGTEAAKNVYLDNLEVTGFPPGALPSFCPNPLETPDYGYTYRRGADFYQDGSPLGSGLGLSSAFQYQAAAGGESGWDYSAKQMSSGTLAAHTNITIEAGTEGGTSTFRTSFNTLTGATPDGTTKGNGLNTGNFADHAEAQFQENGNTWQMTMWYVTAGGTRTQLGAAFNYGNANDATDFTVWVDDRPTATGPPHSNFGLTGGTITSGPYIAITIPDLGINGEDQILGFRALPAAFSSDQIFDIWYIGSAGAISAANTAVDENQQVGDDTGDEGGHDSTCLFDDVGTAVFAGSQGLAPGTTLPTTSQTQTGTCSLFCVDSTTVPEGFTVAAFNLFLGVILMLSIAAGLYFTTKSPLMGGVGGIGGFLIGFAFGLFPLWIIVVLVVLAVAVIFLRTKAAAT